MGNTTIACEKCGTAIGGIATLALHLKTMHGMPTAIAIEAAHEMCDTDERIRQAAPELLKELEIAIAWIDQLTTYVNPDPSAPYQHELLGQLRAAVAKARG